MNPDRTRRWLAGEEGLVNDVPCSPATGKVHAFSPDGEQIRERSFGNFDPLYYVRSEPVVMRGTRLLVGTYDGVFVISD